MLSRTQLFVFISFFLIYAVVSAEDEKLFELTVEISEGANAPDWERVVFSGFEEPGPEKEAVDPEDKSAEKKERKKKSGINRKTNKNKKSVPGSSVKLQESSEKQAEKTRGGDYSSASGNWGEYYGTTPRYDYPLYEKEPEKEIKSAEVKEEKLIASEEEDEDPSNMSVDLILQTQHDIEFDPMLSTGIRVNFANIYSTLSLGTDYGTSSQRAYSLGISAGGFYKISDFALKAGLGYKKIWDNTENSNFNDWSLGVEAGGSYSIFSWLASGAGIGMNYSVLKNSGFTDGRFVPTFFADFEFNLIR